MFENTQDPERIEEQQQPPKSVLETYPADAVELLEAAQLTPDEQPEPLRPLLRYIDGRCGRAADFLARGTLTMITGQKGCRKSTFVRALCAILLNGSIQGENPHTLTARAAGLKIAVIDTEQHRSRVYGHYKWLQRLYKGPQPFATRCGYYSGRGMDAESLRALVCTICETAHPDVIFLDVISHFVDDINEQRPAKLFIDFINQLCNKYGCAIVGIIHQNPSKEATAADKMAGALGTKLLQAAECVLHVARTPEGSQEANGVWDDVGPLYGKGSIITFAEYRERWPDLLTLLIRNENERGEFELSIHPAEIKLEGKPGFAKYLKAFLQPENVVTHTYKQLQQAETAARSPELQPEQPEPEAEKLSF